jgi:hypothetical protein
VVDDAMTDPAPLDLRAEMARFAELRQLTVEYQRPEECPDGYCVLKLDTLGELLNSGEALLAELRAARAALSEGIEYMHPITCASMDGWEDSGKPCDCWHSRAATVLQRVTDRDDA